MSLIPTKPVEATRLNPKKLVIYSKPKVGKTEALLQLPNSLLIDLEDSSDYYTGFKVNVLKEAKKTNSSPLQILKNLQDELKKNPVKRLIIDTVTVLEDISLPYAKALYKASPQGLNFNGDNVLHLANGAGYMWTREAFFKVLKGFEECCEEIIYVGHLKSTLINKNGEEVSSKEIDLTGKIKQMLSADVDGIGLLYREDNKCILSFETSDNVICGTRSAHLSNKKITLSEKIGDKLVTFWDEIYLPEKN